MAYTNSNLSQDRIQPLAGDNTGTLALQLAGLGWPVFPCRSDKRPYTQHGKDDASTDLEQIRTWWGRWPDALIGIYCQRSGLFALDIDNKNGKDGSRSWAELVETYGAGRPVEAGPMQQTPSGGYHVLFKYPEGLEIPNNADKLGKGLDLRSNGYICTGPGYTWLPDHGPDAPLTAAPAWLLELIRNLGERPRPAQPQAAPVASSGDAGAYWLDYYLERATVGNRNDTGFALACQLRDSGLIEGEAESIMTRYAASVPGDGYTDREALASLRSAYQSPRREAAHLPGITISTNGNGYHPEPPSAWPVEAQTPDNNQPNSRRKPAAPTEPKLAARWIDAHPLTAWGQGEFRRYSDGAWNIVHLDTIKLEIKRILDAAEGEGVRPSARMVNSVTELARLEVTIPPEQWDANADILVCANGALHIPSRTLLPHAPDHYATSRLDYDYDPDADAQVFRYVVNTCAYEAQDFLQEFAGYALTTDTSHEIAIWLYGLPGGGKSTILAGLQAMLGKRAGLLGLADIEKSRFALTDLPGKTLMVSAEQPVTYMVATHILNAIISGEPITVDRKFREPVTIMPRAKIAWAMNDLPRVSDAGSGLFRRVKVVRFSQIPEGDRDPAIKEAVKGEGAGILNWALEGLARLRARGRFEIPACVQDATAHFQETNDVPAVFVGEKCFTGPDYKTQGSSLYQTYRTWCLENGHKPQSSTSVAEDWRRLGFDKYMANGRGYWRGVGLIEDNL